MGKSYLPCLLDLDSKSCARKSYDMQVEFDVKEEVELHKGEVRSISPQRKKKGKKNQKKEEKKKGEEYNHKGSVQNPQRKKSDK